MVVAATPQQGNFVLKKIEYDPESYSILNVYDAIKNHSSYQAPEKLHLH